MKIRGADFIYYQTSDLDRAIEFYRDTLGLELLHHFEEVKWAEFSAGNITLALNDPTAFDPNAMAQTGGAAVAFAVENVTEAQTGGTMPPASSDATAAPRPCRWSRPPGHWPTRPMEEISPAYRNW